MKNMLMIGLILTIGLLGVSCSQEKRKDPEAATAKPENLETIYFGAGCFWCTEAGLKLVPGVWKVTVGYQGGKNENPTYKQICTGNTGHAETARVEYDAKKTNFETLMKVFWTIHDPTSLNKQGADEGTQYRSAVFYTSEKQKAAVMSSRDAIQKTLAKKIVTEIAQAPKFWPGEDYHQEYFRYNPDKPYCLRVVAPKVKKAEELLKESSASGEAVQKVVKSEEEWKKLLDPQAYTVLRKKGTERSFTGKLLKNTKEGTYVCGGCELELFSSETKFKSGTGWPSFWKPIAKPNVAELRDNSHGRTRVEVLCARCDGHLGHVFTDGPKPTGLRYCINSVSLKFKEKGKEIEKDAEKK